jgi:hypothetical protein
MKAWFARQVRKLASATSVKLTRALSNGFRGTGDAWLRDNARWRGMNMLGTDAATFREDCRIRARMANAPLCLNLYLWSGADGTPVAFPFNGAALFSGGLSDDWCKERAKWLREAYIEHGCDVCLWLMPDDSSRSLVADAVSNPGAYLACIDKAMSVLGRYVVACVAGLEADEYPQASSVLTLALRRMRDKWGVRVLGVHGKPGSFAASLPDATHYFYQYPTPYPRDADQMVRATATLTAWCDRNGKQPVAAEYDWSSDSGLGKVALDAGCVHFGNG